MAGFRNRSTSLRDWLQEHLRSNRFCCKEGWETVREKRNVTRQRKEQGRSIISAGLVFSFCPLASLIFNTPFSAAPASLLARLQCRPMANHLAASTAWDTAIEEQDSSHSPTELFSSQRDKGSKGQRRRNKSSLCPLFDPLSLCVETAICVLCAAMEDVQPPNIRCMSSLRRFHITSQDLRDAPRLSYTAARREFVFSVENLAD